jgi:hypothetical protein
MEQTNQLPTESTDTLAAARTRLTKEVLEFIRTASRGDLRKAAWLLSNALSSKLIRPAGTYLGRYWHSHHDSLCMTKPYAGAPLRQRDFCCTTRFLFLLVERMNLTTVDELFFAAVELE